MQNLALAAISQDLAEWLLREVYILNKVVLNVLVSSTKSSIRKLWNISNSKKSVTNTMLIYRKAFTYCNEVTSGVQWESCNHLKLQEAVVYQQYTSDSSHFLHNTMPKFLLLSK